VVLPALLHAHLRHGRHRGPRHPPTQVCLLQRGQLPAFSLIEGGLNEHHAHAPSWEFDPDPPPSSANFKLLRRIKNGF
jgi:hypothetical protein